MFRSVQFQAQVHNMHLFWIIQLPICYCKPCKRNRPNQNLRLKFSKVQNSLSLLRISKHGLQPIGKWLRLFIWLNAEIGIASIGMTVDSRADFVHIITFTFSAPSNTDRKPTAGFEYSVFPSDLHPNDFNSYSKLSDRGREGIEKSLPRTWFAVISESRSMVVCLLYCEFSPHHSVNRIRGHFALLSSIVSSTFGFVVSFCRNVHSK
jgi:hypothetical protein